MTSPHSPPSHIPGSFTTDCQASGTTWNLMQWPWLKMLKSWQLHLGRPGRRSLGSPMPSSLDKARRKMARTSAMSETDLTDLTVKSCGWSRIYNKFIQILYRFYTDSIPYIQCILYTPFLHVSLFHHLISDVFPLSLSSKKSKIIQTFVCMALLSSHFNNLRLKFGMTWPSTRHQDYLETASLCLSLPRKCSRPLFQPADSEQNDCMLTRLEPSWVGAFLAICKGTAHVD